MANSWLAYPDTQDEVRGDGEEGGEENLEGALPSEDLTDLKELTEESDLLSDIFGLDLKSEKGAVQTDSSQSQCWPE